MRKGNWGFRILLFIFFLVWGFSSSATNAEDHYKDKKIVIGVEKGYPPYCIVDEKGEASGFSVDIIRAACKVMGYEAQFKIGLWSEVKDELANESIDALPLVARNEEREQIFDFTFPYITMHGTIVVRKDETNIQSLMDLDNKEVAILRDDIAEEYLRKHHPKAKIITTNTFEQALSELSQGKHDAVVVQKLLALHLIERIGADNLETKRNLVEDLSESYCFAVKKGDKKLLDILNEGLSVIMTDGTFRRLQSKWFKPIESNKPIVFGGDINYPPFEFLDKNGKPTGYNVDLTRAIASRLGVEVEIKLEPWTEVIDKLKNNEIDAIMGMYYTPERSLRYNISQAHTLISQAIVVREKDKRPKGFSDLDNKSILVQNGDVMHDLAIEKGYEDQLILTSTQEDALRILASGKYDCALVAKLPALYWINRYNWDNLHVIEQAVLSPEYCYAAPVGNEALLARLTEAITELKESGEYRKIRKKWFGVYESVGFWEVVRYSSFIIIPILLLLAILLVWSKMLQRKIVQKTSELQNEIAERKKAEELVKQSEAKLIELNAAKDKFFSIIAHDLKSPFNGILGLSDQLRNHIRKYSNEKIEKMANLIYSASKNTFDLLVNLLEWANFQQGIISYNPEKKLVKGLFEKVKMSHGNIAKQKNIELNFDSTDGLYMYVDEEMILSVLRNLVMNAIKFTHSEGSVWVSAYESEGMTEIKVSDNGMGMNQETKNNLFKLETNQSQPGTNNEKGSGLGLVLCKEFIDKHGGKIWTTSEPGKGSNFIFTLPIK